MKTRKNTASLADFNNALKRKVIDTIDSQEKKCCISLKERIVFKKCYQLQSMGEYYTMAHESQTGSLWKHIQ
jgi:hypothetical protein